MSNKFLQISDFYKRLNHYKKYKKSIILNTVKKDCFLPKSIVQYFYQDKKKQSINSIKNRCILTGRARAVSSKYRLSRMPLKYFALHGFLPGVNKFSW